MKKWRFISNQNSTIVGINDAGIETFTSNMNKSLVRESIQNSLDAKIPNSKKPVIVEFDLFKVKKSIIPDGDNLQSIIKKCKESNIDEPDAYKFFDDADRILENEDIDVLRISDYNTIGLEGTETCGKGTSWSRLVKENGSSNKGKNSGGSFGIGKSSAFVCSDLRTVFYSSLDRKALKSNFGVARLVSYEDEILGWTTGTGYYSENDRFVAIPELACFDKEYVRTESGTDIYILGMHHIENFKEVFTEAVLMDFFVSIVQKKLIVKIQNEIIDSNTINKYIAKLNPYKDEKTKELIEYYNLLTSSNPNIIKIELDAKKYGKEFGFKNGECTLYLQEGEGLNRKILITRSAGMRIFEQNRISGSIEFTGVLVIEGMNMNETFKKMEVPSHDAWEPGRCRGEEKYYESIFNGLKRYLKTCVKECFGTPNTDSIDAIGASDFLPDKLEEGTTLKMKKNELSTRIKGILGKSVSPSKKKSKAIDIKEVDLVGDDKGEINTGNGSFDDMPGSGKASGNGADTSKEPTQKESGKKREDGESKAKENYKEIPVKKRLVCSDLNNGIYRLTFRSPTKSKRGKLQFNVSGEQSDFGLPIIDARIINCKNSVKIDGIQNNEVILNDLNKGELIELEVKVDFDSYCMMEVDYYANKK